MQKIKVWFERYQLKKSLKAKRASLQSILWRGETVLTMGKNMGKEPDADDLRAMEELLEELREKIACINAQIKEVGI